MAASTFFWFCLRCARPKRASLFPPRRDIPNADGPIVKCQLLKDRRCHICHRRLVCIKLGARKGQRLTPLTGGHGPDMLMPDRRAMCLKFLHGFIKQLLTLVSFLNQLPHSDLTTVLSRFLLLLGVSTRYPCIESFVLFRRVAGPVLLKTCIKVCRQPKSARDDESILW